MSKTTTFEAWCVQSITGNLKPTIRVPSRRKGLVAISTFRDGARQHERAGEKTVRVRVTVEVIEESAAK